jgi:hypothetical protein
MMNVLGASDKSVMLLASLLFITAFEIAFHYLGTRQAVLTEALVRLGNVDIGYAEELKRMKKAEKFRAKTDGMKAARKTTQDKDSPVVSINRIIEKAKPQNVGFTPATAFTSNEKTGSHEKQYDMFPATKTAKTRQALEAEIADMKVKISQLKNGVSESEKAPVSDPSPTVSKLPVLDRRATVANDRSATVEKGSTDATVKPLNFGVLGEDSFSKLYAYILPRVKSKKVKPSVKRFTKRCTSICKFRYPTKKDSNRIT